MLACFSGAETAVYTLGNDYTKCGIVDSIVIHRHRLSYLCRHVFLSACNTQTQTQTHMHVRTLLHVMWERERETVEESERDTKDIDVCGCIIYTHAYIHTYIDNYMHT